MCYWYRYEGNLIVLPSFVLVEICLCVAEMRDKVLLMPWCIAHLNFSFPRFRFG